MLLSLISGVQPIVSRTLSQVPRLRSCFIYRELPRLGAGRLIGGLASSLSAAACSESAFLAESARRAESPFATSVESRLMRESPARGGASGCLKYTGNRIDTGTGCPCVLA